MNQLIVILIILRNLMKPFASSIFRLLLCVIALCVSFYIYQVYNDVTKQNVNLYYKTKGAVADTGGMVNITFNYIEDRPDSVPAIKLTCFSKLEKCNNGKISSNNICNNIFISDFDHNINRTFKSADFFATSGIITDYEDNNWFFPHPVSPHRQIKSAAHITDGDTIILHDFAFIRYSKKMDINLRTDDFLGLDFGKDKSYWAIQNIIALDWDYLSSHNDSVQNYWYRGSASCYEDFFTPKWYSAFDVSKIQTNIFFDRCDSLSMLVISYGQKVSNISEIIPEPDEKTIHGISYTSAEKLDILKNRGLSIFATFPEYESLQQTRNYVLSAIITLFLTLTATIGWNFTCKLYKQIRRLKRIRKKSFQNHPSIYIRLSKLLVFSNLFVTYLILTVIYIINPYSWSLYEFIEVLIISTGMVLFIISPTAPKYRKASTSVIKFSKHLLYSGIIITILGFILLFITQHYSDHIFIT